MLVSAEVPARHWWSSIKTKLAVLVISLLGGISLFIYLFFPARQERQAMRALAAKAQSIAEMSAFTVGPALFFRDAETIGETLASARQNEELVYLEILDTGQQVLASFNRAEGAQLAGGRRAGEDLYEMRYPILYTGQQIGQLHLGLSLGQIAEESRQSRRSIALVSLVIFAIGVGAVLAISAVVTRPLARVVHTAERISGGDLGQRVPLSTGDEIGLLARAFNRMVDHLEAAQGALEKANRSLEERVAERTRELQEEIDERRRAEAEKTRLEEQLRQAQKLEAVGQLSAGIAHNFNNLLQAIMANIDLAEMKGPEKVQAYLKDADAAATRGAELVRQLMLFARAGTREPCFQEVDLGAIIANTASLCRRTIDRRIELEVEIAPHLPRVRADAGQLEQVLLNLYLNARDALEEVERPVPRIRTRARLTRQVPPGEAGARDFVLIEVSDNGTGMDPQTRERVFEPFFTTKEVGKGTGLGLAMVYGILQQHGGWIECQSEKGRGTAFSLYLPSGAETGDQAPAEVESGLRPGTETLLIIDDEELVRLSAVRFFAELGYRVLEAEDGQRGLEIFDRQGEVDLVLLDLSMPGLSGKEVFDRLKAQAPWLKVILFTGYAFDRREFEGVADIVEKPFALRQLARVVRQTLDQ
jgi:signal transduction histidine kinase